MRKIDKYIIAKYLTTFFYCIGLIVVVTIVFDISEKLDDFLEKHAPLKEIILDYYLNFIPYFVNLFSPLFLFISVIFFTAQMANRTEIIAIMNAGVSFRRLLRPYIIASSILAAISFALGGYVIPHAKENQLAFENKYIKNQYRFSTKNLHRQVKPKEYIYFESYNNIEKMGYLFSYEKFSDKNLLYKLTADKIVWDSIKGNWRLENYLIRHFNGMTESYEKGEFKDTVFNFKASDFGRRPNFIEGMDNIQLRNHIAQEKLRGADDVQFAEVEYNQRFSFPYAMFVLTIIGVSIAFRKVRGGIGLQIVAGILLSFSYILFMKVSTTFATNSNVPAIIAVWIPNMFYTLIALWMVKGAQK